MCFMCILKDSPKCDLTVCYKIWFYLLDMDLPESVNDSDDICDQNGVDNVPGISDCLL